jgi:hypothetical protein
LIARSGVIHVELVVNRNYDPSRYVCHAYKIVQSNSDSTDDGDVGAALSTKCTEEVHEATGDY